MVPPRACVFTTALKGRGPRNPPPVRRIKRMLILLHALGMASCLQSSPRGLHVGSQIARMVSSASSSMVMGLTKWPRNMAAYQPRAHRSAATSFVAAAPTGGFTSEQLGDLLTELRTTNRIYQQHASKNAPAQPAEPGPPGPLHSNNPCQGHLAPAIRATYYLPIAGDRAADSE